MTTRLFISSVQKALAVAHRDYAAAAAIQVSVFADRIEIRNPGDLTPPLTPEGLRHPHSSIARNAHLCDALFLARYIEKFGTGTLMMIRESRAHALAEPDFAAASGEFVLTLWRDTLSATQLASFNLNPRQLLAINYLRGHSELTNTAYQALCHTSKRTAHRDLTELLAFHLIAKQGTTGKGVSYRLAKGAAKGPKGPKGPSV